MAELRRFFGAPLVRSEVTRRDPSGTADLLTVGEAADRLKVSRATVYRLCSTGGLASVRVGHAWRILLDMPESERPQS